MRYDVEWKESALDELAGIWNDADSAGRPAVRAAVNRIDAILAADPVNAGESRPHGRRLQFEGPLAVWFRVYPNQKAVQVFKVLSP
jgi:plasmid stabilization system protein ParE